MAVASGNGSIDFGEHDFQVLYSRRNNDRIAASLVAIKDGVIRAKIDPGLDGKTQAEAFMAFRKDVEMRLDRILKSVPSSIPAEAAPSRASSSTQAPLSPLPADQPPAYDFRGLPVKKSEGKA